MAFPLFKFPILVIKLILETMGFHEIFVLINASSKTKRIVKKLLTIRNYKMLIYMREKLFVFSFQLNSVHESLASIFMESEGNPPANAFHLKIGSIDRVPSAFGRTERGNASLKIYWSTNINHGNELYTALCEVFRIPLNGIQVELTTVTDENCRSWINWINDAFYDIPLLEVVGKCSFQMYIWILNNARTKNELQLRVEPTEYPENPENIEILNAEVASVAVIHGSWIRVQELKSIKAQSIVIYKASLTDAQINLFLRDWRNSEVASNLRELKIYFSREANSDVVLEEMDATDEHPMKPFDALRQWSFNMANGETCTVIYAFYTDEEHGEEFGFEFQVGN